MAVRIQVAGVGGHGVILVARVLSQAALDTGRHSVMSEVHGMSQRGGIVQSTVVIDGGDAPLVRTGQANLLVASEAGEALRNGPVLRPGGTLVLNRLAVPPPHLVETGGAYLQVEDAADWFVKRGMNVWVVDGQAIAEAMQNTRVMNAAMLGAVAKSGALPFGLKELRQALLRVTHGRFAETNIQAMQQGYDTVHKMGTA